MTRHTPYFDAYEAKKAIKEYWATKTTHIVSETPSAAPTDGEYLQISPSSSSFSTLDYSCMEYPKYRLLKEYTFIGQVKVLRDVKMQAQQNHSSDWYDLPEGFNTYNLNS